MYQTIKQFAQEYQLHPETVRRLCRSGKIFALKIGKSWRIPNETQNKEPLRRNGR